ncbi:MAG: T9SS type A sorting domain-containing protein, partial [Paludibacteraceae bacterium]
IPDGVNSFNARFRDEFGAWTAVQSHFFLKQTTAAGTGTVKKITALEYWINGNSTERTHRALTAQSTYNWEELLDYAAIPDGVNSFNARFRDEFGAWSTVQSQFFLKQTTAAGTGTVKKITVLEYWINGNSTNRTHRALTAQNTYNWEELLDYAAIPDGVNSFNARFRDEFGAWSTVQSHFFLKQTTAAGTGTVKKITALEYWINGNSTERTHRTLTAQNTYNWEELLDYSTIPDGVNTFNARFRDEFGAWTAVQSHFILKQTIATGENKIVGYRLWYAAEPEYIHDAAVVSPASTADINDSVSVTYLPKGSHQISYQVKDVRGVWSPVVTDTISKTDNAFFSFTADKREISQNESVKFTPSIRHFIDSIVWNFGDGMTEVNFEPVHTYDSIGHFDVTATVWHKGTLEGISYVEIKYISVISTGISTPEVSTIRMYPVPVSDMLTVESPDTPLRALRVVTLNGTIVRQVTCRGENTSDISLGGLSPGTYIILTTTDKGVFSGKVVKK